MLPNEMDLLIQERQKTGKKKQKNQVPHAIITLLITLAIFGFLWRSNHEYSAIWIIGIGIGLTLRYSRFCFSAALRDPFTVGNTKLFRGMLLAMMISTIGFGAIQYTHLKNNVIDFTRLPGSITTVGPHIAIGAFMFGIGMVIAGGCASGVLMRIGEGHALQWIVLVGFLIGNLMGAKNYDFWYERIIKNTRVIYFPGYIDIRIVVLIQLIILMILYRLAALYEKRKSRF